MIPVSLAPPTPAYRPRSRTINRPRAGQAGSLGENPVAGQECPTYWISGFATFIPAHRAVHSAAFSQQSDFRIPCQSPEKLFICILKDMSL
jgi:hypothetical protein